MYAFTFYLKCYLRFCLHFTVVNSRNGLRYILTIAFIKSIEDDIRIELSNCYHNIEISSYKEVDYDPRWIRVKDREPVVGNKLRSENVYIRYGNDGPAEIAFIAWNTQWYDLNCDVIDKPDFWRYMTEDEKHE